MKRIYKIAKITFGAALIAFVVGGLPSRHLSDQITHMFPVFAFALYLWFNNLYVKCQAKEQQDEMPQM